MENYLPTMDPLDVARWKSHMDRQCRILTIRLLWVVGIVACLLSLVAILG
jgi:hypothetical protein